MLIATGLILLLTICPYLLNAEIIWGNQEFLRVADDCRFRDGPDSGNLDDGKLTAKSRYECGEMCFKHDNCTHFNWLPENQSRCVLKKANLAKRSNYIDVFESRASETSGTQCGFLQIKWNIEKASDLGQTEWAYNCEFVGNDIDRVSGTANICGGECERKANCNHFTWKGIDQKGICYLKSGGEVGRGNEVYQPKAICGTVRRG